MSMVIFGQLGTLQYVGIALVGVVSTSVVLFFLLRDQRNIKASDGTLFSSEEACKSYEVVLDRVNALFLDTQNQSAKELLGFQIAFLNLLKGSFTDAKLIIRYKDDFKRLVELIDQDIPQ